MVETEVTQRRPAGPPRGVALGIISKQRTRRSITRTKKRPTVRWDRRPSSITLPKRHAAERRRRKPNKLPAARASIPAGAGMLV